MKIKLLKDEWYPVYLILNDPAKNLSLPEYDLPEDLITRYNYSLSQFSSVLEELEKAIQQEWGKDAGIN